MEIDFGSIDLFEWELLYSIEMDIQLGILALRKLINNQENALVQVENEFQEQVRLELDRLKPEDRNSYFMQVLNADHLVISELLKQQRYGICVSIFSFFEARMRSLTTLIESHFEVTGKLKKIKGESIIGMDWRYLKEVLGIDNSSLEQNFSFIHANKQFRNVIVHHDGFVFKKDLDNMPKGIAGVEVVECGNSYMLVIGDPVFFENLLCRMEDFFKPLLTVVDRRSLAFRKQF